MKLRLTLVAVLAAAAAACGGSEGTGGDDIDTPGDVDGDGISDADEGQPAGTDTDGDGTPDAEDDDSDGDGVPDYREAGDTDPGTRPVDSDSDGTPDFRDTDSDGNGRLDGVDGAGDVDTDGTPDFADLDDDGDFITDVNEIGADPAAPIDTDEDGTPDFRDTDSDNDTILDSQDGFEDYDDDAAGNWRDTDSDGDCRSDMVESGGANPPRDTDSDGRPDFIDRDSDDDGIADTTEDTNCNGVRDGSETDPGNGDTDGDGVSDLIEQAAGTDPNSSTDNPQANGDFVFVVPYQAPPSPMDDDLDFTTRISDLDVYVVVDRSGSMSGETSTIKNNLGGVIDRLQCPPFGTGAPATCIPNLYAGLGAVGYVGSEPFRNYLDIQVDPNFAGQTISNVSGSDTREPLTFGVWASTTGSGTAAAAGCTFGATVAPRTNCPAGTYGYPCFRNNALSVIALVTDEVPLASGDTYVCPSWATTRAALATHSAKLMGIYGSGSSATVISDLGTMARDTGAVDAGNGNAPLVFNGADANAATAIENGIRTLANGVPLDMGARSEDDPADAVDAVAAFVDHLETLQLGTAACTGGLVDRDTNADTFDDEYTDVRAGTPVCWKLVPRTNVTVPATDRPQLFRATVRVTGDGVTTLDTRDVFFLIPPVALDPPIG